MKMTAELALKLQRFKPRPYQTLICDAIEKKGFKKVLAILPRRAGKDITAWNLAIRQCLRKTCTVFYILPEYSMAKRIIWDAIDNDGFRLLDYIPNEIATKYSSDMKIRFNNGSILKLVGSDNYDSLVGSNFQAAIYSEYSLQDPNAYNYLRPIAVANGAWLLLISTPRGFNHMYEMYNIALNNPDWYCLKMTVEETGHIPIEVIRKEQEEGLISEDLIQQEYYTSFSLGIEGSFYNKYIDKMKLNKQIGPVAWESAYKVHTAWDLGIRDATAVIFFQVCNNIVRIIDFYENTDHGLEHYAQILQEKGYNYGVHVAPHDIRVREFTSGGVTRLDKAAQLGIKFMVCNSIPIADGIECVRSKFSQIWIDSDKCAQLIKSLENYRKEYDSKRKVYSSHPRHDWSSNACFIGDTRISLSSGDIAIKDVKEGMLVKTPFGLRRVLKVHTRLTDELVDIHVGNTHLTCTLDHEIFTNKGLIKAIMIWPTYILEPIGRLRGWIWKKIYGYYSKRPYPRGFKKILLNMDISDTSTLMDTFLDGMINRNIGLVVYAKCYSFIVSRLLKRHVIKNIYSYRLIEPKEVYDLTIEEDNCYYANGYLVSNCDAMRYLCISLPRLREGLTPEELDRRYREAMSGGTNTPRPFKESPW